MENKGCIYFYTNKSAYILTFFKAKKKSKKQKNKIIYKGRYRVFKAELLRQKGCGI